ncbi:MAG: DNA translocase FtsK [Planctomycetes bacterium]|nr:DNA translocase FtsK [Planctomycetota bacterium]
MLEYRRIISDLVALVLLAGIVFCGLSLATYSPADPPAAAVFPPPARVANSCGAVGAWTAHSLQSAFGGGAWIVVAWLISTDVRLFARSDTRGMLVRLFGGLLVVSALCTGASLAIVSIERGPVVGAGGYVGAWAMTLLDQHFAVMGQLILLASCLTAGLVMSGETAIFRLAWLLVTGPSRLLTRLLVSRRAADTNRKAPQRAPRRAAALVLAEDSSADDDLADEHEDDEGETDLIDPQPKQPAAASVDSPRRPIKVNPPVTAGSFRERVMQKLDRIGLGAGVGEYRLPNLDLLEDAEDFPYDLLAQKAQVAAEILERTFQEFGLNVRVVEVDTGPVITQFELELEKGLRLSKVTALADDLAIALRVPAVRVVAPIPGKNTVGVEVPNEKQVMVRLRELIEACPDDIEKRRIPIFLGKDVSGHPLTVDLTKMPHLLIAGRTGTGKSVCLNALILSILMTRTPDQVKMLMIDPKMVELSPYKRVPHLMHPVITDMKKAEAVLAWAVDKMEERYDLLSRCGVRHLDAYNKLGREKVLDRLGLDPDDPEHELEIEAVPESMPYIVIVADEMADMMMTSGRDVEGHIIRLAQKSRAVGIHLVLATQKPTVDVITGLIKSNLPARISFQVASRTDSRVVLDEMGADRLLGNGDMLYLAPGTSNLTRAQGAFVSDEEVNGIIEFFSDREPEYSTELAQLSAAGGAKAGGAGGERDELYDEAVEIVIREQMGSVSRLQRFLGIGYGRAARLIDHMAEDGIVGDYNGSKAREVLYTPEQWSALHAGSAAADGDDGSDRETLEEFVAVA